MGFLRWGNMCPLLSTIARLLRRLTRPCPQGIPTFGVAQFCSRDAVKELSSRELGRPSRSTERGRLRLFAPKLARERGLSKGLPGPIACARYDIRSARARLLFVQTSCRPVPNLGELSVARRAQLPTGMALQFGSAHKPVPKCKNYTSSSKNVKTCLPSTVLFAYFSGVLP